jgi:RNA polymerase sigma factor (sigma-70 family)
MLDQWYERYNTPLKNFIRSKGFTPEDAEDICAQVFLEAVQRQPEDIAPRAWLYRVAQSRVIDRQRQIRRRGHAAPLEEWTASVEAPETHESATRAALLLLTPAQQRVIEARFLGEQSLDETARHLGMSTETVKALQHRGIAAMRTQFAGFTLPHRSIPHERNWAADDIERLRLGILQGWNDKAIAHWLGRTPIAIRVKAKKLHIPRRPPTTGTARDVAVALGVGCAKTVQRWAGLDWLPAQRSSDERGATWRFLWADVWAFCENPAYWMAWRPERITDPARRTWAIEMRRDQPRWLMPGEVAMRYHVTRNVVTSWVLRFGLPATRYGNWWINERDLESWIAPGERPRTYGWGHPRKEP